MSKIVFSVLCVLLSFVMLFTFVRASFGQDPLTAREFVTKVSKISTDFSRTKENMQSLKDAFEKIEFPKWGELDLSFDTQDDLRMQNGNMARFSLSECTIKDDGTLVAPNGACYTSMEYRVTGDVVRVMLDWFSQYTPLDYLIASIKDSFIENDEGFLAGICKGVLYINSFLEYFDSILIVFFEFVSVGIAMAKDTVFFVVDVVLFLLEMIGIDTAGTLPST